jgi:hypothetical protein
MTAATTTASRPLAARLAAAAALTGGAMLLAKVLLIVVTSNGLPTGLETGLYLGGVVLPLVAAGAWGAAVRPDAHAGMKWALGLAAAVLHVGYIMVLSDAVGTLVSSFTATAYLVDEVPVAIAGLVWVLAAVWLIRRDATPES